MRYPDSVEFLYALGNEIKTVKFGLDSVRAVLRELGNPQTAFRSVHVAGTNGKGSTCAMIEAALWRAGQRTGLYTSPHLIEPTERIRIDGRAVSRDEFARAFAEVHDANQRLLASGRLEHHTTYFETVTAMAFLLFRDADVERAVVEVGLGGRLDATNVIDPEICVITPVDFDHEQFLGNSLEAIAGEKAGILKPGRPAVFGPQRPEAQRVLDQRAPHAVRTSEYELRDVHLHAYGCEFTARRSRDLHVRCPLAGVHQLTNAVTAAAVLDALDVPVDGIADAQWPGRLQRIGDDPEIVLDGAHNPAGARALAEHMRRFYNGRTIWLVYGAMRDKSVEEIMEILFPLADAVVLTAPDSPRAVRPEAIQSAVDHPDIRVAPTAAQAFAAARSAPPGAAVFITGSLYLVGEILSLIQ
jgi:dihydrofolate synthase / folylpolyglutamate synthase